jgi:hypothetical protein
MAFKGQSFERRSITMAVSKPCMPLGYLPLSIGDVYLYNRRFPYLLFYWPCISRKNGPNMIS